mgnify:CR=1 FL=1
MRLEEFLQVRRKTLENWRDTLLSIRKDINQDLVVLRHRLRKVDQGLLRARALSEADRGAQDKLRVTQQSGSVIPE